MVVNFMAFPNRCFNANKRPIFQSTHVCRLKHMGGSCMRPGSVSSIATLTHSPCLVSSPLGPTLPPAVTAHCEAWLRCSLCVCQPCHGSGNPWASSHGHWAFPCIGALYLDYSIPAANWRHMLLCITHLYFGLGGDLIT